jgi:hypothetical protein
VNTKYDETRLSDDLVTTYGYAVDDVLLLLRDLRDMQPNVRSAFAEWYSLKKLPTFEIEGYSFDLLQKSFGMNPFAAFLTLDSLLTNPTETKQGLDRGIDKIV